MNNRWPQITKKQLFRIKHKPIEGRPGFYMIEEGPLMYYVISYNPDSDDFIFHGKYRLNPDNSVDYEERLPTNEEREIAKLHGLSLPEGVDPNELRLQLLRWASDCELSSSDEIVSWLFSGYDKQGMEYEIIIRAKTHLAASVQVLELFRDGIEFLQPPDNR